MAAAAGASGDVETGVVSVPCDEDLLDFYREAVEAPLQAGGTLWDPAFAAAADAKDPLRHFRSRYHFPPTEETARIRKDQVHKPGIYLCGNSLGLQPKQTAAYVSEELDKWRRYGVEGHFRTERPWVTVDETVHKEMATVVGAKPVEVVVMNTLTCNLHFMMVPFYRPTATRHKIVIEKKAFPSDWQAVWSQIRERGYDPATSLVELGPREGESTLRTEDIIQYLEENGSEVALVLLSGVQYYTGQCFDMEAITRAGHAAGAKVGWDLAHAAGNVPLALHEWGPDFAVWCTYKYLNSGPGSLGGCFVHERHADDQELQRFAGWWGHRKSDRFQMASAFIPRRGAMGFQVSNPPVLPLAAVRASLEVLVEAGGMAACRRKSLAMTTYLELLVRARLPSVKVVTPTAPALAEAGRGDATASHRGRGCQLSLEFPGSSIKQVYKRLQEESVIVDVREPNAMRVAPAPMYNSFADCLGFVLTLEQVLKEVEGAA